MLQLILLAGLATAMSFQDFKAKYNKKYLNPVEEFRRMAIFRDNLNLIKRLEAAGHEVEVNIFADMTKEEFERTHLGMLRELPAPSAAKETPVYGLPTSVDRRSELGPARDQGNCGSCWTFCTAAVVESRMKVKYSKSLDLAEQQMVDCDTTDNGCNGGHPVNALAYVQKYGLTTEAKYPYTQKAGTCKSFTPVAKVTGVKALGDGENLLAEALANKGTVAVGIYASLDSFRYYKAGTIYSDASCPNRYMNHCVTAVGYGVQNGQEYWLIRNSWGTSWGDKGYFMLAKNKNYMCGIGRDSTIPTDVSQ